MSAQTDSASPSFAWARLASFLSVLPRCGARGERTAATEPSTRAFIRARAEKSRAGKELAA